jgi:NitT/TauT family transport system ATP-binding protein
MDVPVAKTISAGPHVAVRVAGVSKVFDGGTRALDAVSLAVPAGQFLALLGPSGCGKSTLLRIVAGLERPTTGEIAIRDDAALGYVFQDAHLLPWRTALRNVTLPLELRGVAKPARVEAATRVLEQVGLGEFLHRYPAQLSGGMRMRVSLARALVTDPKLLLMDEPFAALDEITRQRLDEQLLDLWRARAMTVVFVTHSVAEAAFLAQRAVVFSARPGRVVLDHASSLPERRTAALRGEAAFARECRVLFEALETGPGADRHATNGGGA